MTLDGATRTFTVPEAGRQPPRRRHRKAMDAPFACKAGVCSTCRAKVLKARWRWRSTTRWKITKCAQGYVLSCQCYPAQRSHRRQLRPVKGEAADRQDRTSRTIWRRAACCSSPENVPPRYRGELAAADGDRFVDSELAARPGLPMRSTLRPASRSASPPARIILEKADHAERVLNDHGRVRRRRRALRRRIMTGPPAWRATRISARRGRAATCAFRSFTTPLDGWIDAVVMNVLHGPGERSCRSTELARVSYQPLAEVFRAICPARERAMPNWASQGLVQDRRHEPQACVRAKAAVAYWRPRVAASFGQSQVPQRFETLARFGLRHDPNEDRLLAKWRDEVDAQLSALRSELKGKTMNVLAKQPRRLESYVCGSWIAGAREGVPLLDAATGAPVAFIDSSGIDFAAMLGLWPRQGWPRPSSRSPSTSAPPCSRRSVRR